MVPFFRTDTTVLPLPMVARNFLRSNSRVFLDTRRSRFGDSTHSSPPCEVPPNGAKTELALIQCGQFWTVSILRACYRSWFNAVKVAKTSVPSDRPVKRLPLKVEWNGRGQH